jgi:hypothetical protein
MARTSIEIAPPLFRASTNWMIIDSICLDRLCRIPAHSWIVFERFQTWVDHFCSLALCRNSGMVESKICQILFKRKISTHHTPWDFSAAANRTPRPNATQPIQPPRLCPYTTNTVSHQRGYKNGKLNGWLLCFVPFADNNFSNRKSHSPHLSPQPQNQSVDMPTVNDGKDLLFLAGEGGQIAGGMLLEFVRGEGIRSGGSLQQAGAPLERPFHCHHLQQIKYWTINQWTIFNIC